jgi:hypothetical protein
MLARGNGLHLGAEEGGHLRRRDGPHTRDHLLNEAVGKKAGEGDEKDQRRDECQQEVIGQLRGQS